MRGPCSERRQVYPRASTILINPIVWRCSGIIATSIVQSATSDCRRIPSTEPEEPTRDNPAPWNITQIKGRFTPRSQDAIFYSTTDAKLHWKASVLAESRLIHFFDAFQCGNGAIIGRQIKKSPQMYKTSSDAIRNPRPRAKCLKLSQIKL